MDNFDLNGFIRDFKAGKNPYGGTPQSLTESTTPEPTKETSKETYVNEFLSEVEAKLNKFRDNSDEIDDLLSDLEDGPDVEDLYGDVTVSHGERKPYDPLLEKEDEDEEEVEVSDEVEVEGEEDMDTDMEEEGGVDDLENHLESALKIARSMGDDKLADQIGNTVTFFTRQYVARDNEGGLDEQKNKELKKIKEGLPDTFLGMPLETFSDYYDALGVAIKFGITAAIAATVIGALGIYKAKKLFSQGKSAVQNWYNKYKGKDIDGGKLEEQNVDIASFLESNKQELLQTLASKFSWDEDDMEEYSEMNIEIADEGIAGLGEGGLDFSFDKNKVKDEFGDASNFTIRIGGKTIYGIVYNF